VPTSVQSPATPVSAPISGLAFNLEFPLSLVGLTSNTACTLDVSSGVCSNSTLLQGPGCGGTLLSLSLSLTHTFELRPALFLIVRVVVLRRPRHHRCCHYRRPNAVTGPCQSAFDSAGALWYQPSGSMMLYSNRGDSCQFANLASGFAFHPANGSMIYLNGSTVYQTRVCDGTVQPTPVIECPAIGMLQGSISAFSLDPSSGDFLTYVSVPVSVSVLHTQSTLTHRVIDLTFD